jgi:hypothetical protein
LIGQVGANIAEDRRVLMEGRFHVGASARLGAIDIRLDGLGNHGPIAWETRGLFAPY